MTTTIRSTIDTLKAAVAAGDLPQGIGFHVELDGSETLVDVTALPAGFALINREHVRGMLNGDSFAAHPRFTSEGSALHATLTALLSPLGPVSVDFSDELRGADRDRAFHELALAALGRAA